MSNLINIFKLIKEILKIMFLNKTSIVLISIFPFILFTYLEINYLQIIKFDEIFKNILSGKLDIKWLNIFYILFLLFIIFRYLNLFLFSYISNRRPLLKSIFQLKYYRIDYFLLFLIFIFVLIFIFNVFNFITLLSFTMLFSFTNISFINFYNYIIGVSVIFSLLLIFHILNKTIFFFIGRSIDNKVTFRDSARKIEKCYFTSMFLFILTFLFVYILFQYFPFGFTKDDIYMVILRNIILYFFIIPFNMFGFAYLYVFCMSKKRLICETIVSHETKHNI